LKNSAVAEILELVERIDAAGQGNDGLVRTIGLADLDRELLEMLGGPFFSAAASE
jgi:hypothetical protein